MWWESFTFAEGTWYRWNLSGTEIFVRREGRNWQSLYKTIDWEKRDNSCAGPEEKEPVSLENVSTNILNRKTAALRPYFPEKPFLVNFGEFFLSPGTKTTLNLTLPPLFRLIAEKPKGAHDHIFSFIPYKLKETWCGKNAMEGFLCSFLPAASNGTDADVHCCLEISNRKKTALELNKIPLFTSGLNIYGKDGTLFSDALIIDAHENNFHMTVLPSKNEYETLLTQCNKT